MPLPPLSPEQQIKPRLFEARISLMFAALFVPLGAHLPYFPLWLEAKGFDAGQIAIILSAPMFLRVLTTPFITAAADRARDRANVLIAMVAASLILSLGYFLPPTYAVVLAVSLALSVVWTPHSPLTDSLALSGVRRFGSIYARMRIWGSAAFLAGNLGGGIILGATSADAVPVIITLGLCGTMAAAFFVPRLGKPRLASPLSATALQRAAPKLLNRHFLLFVAGAGIINGSHGFLYGFVSIYWKSIGLDDALIGLLWAAAVVAEIGMFMVFNRLLGAVPAHRLLMLSGVAAMLRWIAFPLIWPLGIGVAGFFAVQSLHAVSTGLILIAVQKLIGETVPEERTGAAQGIAFFANGLSMAAVTLLSGPLYDHFGVGGFYAAGVIALAGLGLAMVAAQPHSAADGGNTSEPS